MGAERSFVVEDIQARSLICGDALDEGRIVFSVGYPDSGLGFDDVGLPDYAGVTGAVVVYIGMQQSNGLYLHERELTFDADDIVRVARGMPTPWQRSHGWPGRERRRADCDCRFCG